MNNGALNHDVSPKIYESLIYIRISRRFLLGRLIKGRRTLQEHPNLKDRNRCVANELTGVLHRERCQNAVGAVPAVSGATFKAWRDHAE